MMLAATVVYEGDTSIGAFTGGDVGEGLDPDGKFIYAVNARGPAVRAIRDAYFTDEAAAGSPITANFESLNWLVRPEFGATINDDRLESVMHSIRWAELVRLMRSVSGKSLELRRKSRRPA